MPCAMVGYTLDHVETCLSEEGGGHSQGVGGCGWVVWCLRWLGCCCQEVDHRGWEALAEILQRSPSEATSQR